MFVGTDSTRAAALTARARELWEFLAEGRAVADDAGEAGAEAVARFAPAHRG